MKKRLLWAGIAASYLFFCIGFILQVTPPSVIYHQFVQQAGAGDISTLTGVTGKIGREDINFGTGETTDTFTVTGYRGTTITLTRLPSFLANAASIIKGKWYVPTAAAITDHGAASGANYTSYNLKKIIDVIDGAEAAIELPGSTTYTVTTALTIPATVTIEFQRGAQLAGAGNLTFSGIGSIAAGRYQIFDTTGTITFAQGQQLFAEWFASISTAVDQIGSVPAGLSQCSQQTLTANLTTPANLTFKIVHGGSISGAYTFTCNGPFEGCPGCFPDDDLDVAGLKESKPEYWDIDGTADDVQIQAAIHSLTTGGNVLFEPVAYYPASTIELPTATRVNLIGAGFTGAFMGTRFIWSGGNDDSIIQAEGSNIENIFFGVSAAQTGIKGIDANGDGATRTPSRIILKNVHAKTLAYGFYFNYGYYNTLYDCTASYCTVGVRLGQHSNNFGLYNCHWDHNATGIAFAASYSQVILLSGGSIENSTTVGIDMDGGGVPKNFKIQNIYFESNVQSMTVKGYGIDVDTCFFNNETSIFDIVHSGGLNIKNITIDGGMDLDEVYKFTAGTFSTTYEPNSITIGKSYKSGALAAAIANYPDIVIGGYLDMQNSAVRVVRTDLIDASGTSKEYIYPHDVLMGVNKSTTCLCIISVETLIDVGASHIQFRFGRSAGYADIFDVQTEDGVDLAVGAYNVDDLHTVTQATTNVVIYPGSYHYFCNNTAATSGKYRMVFVSAY